MILCLGTTPAAQRVMVFRQLSLDKVNRAAQTLDGIAGKSINVAKVLHALGERPLATGFLGGPRGEQIAQDLTARGIASAFLTVTTPTRQCVTVIDQSTGAITELVEESQPVDRAAYDQLLKMVEEKLPNCRAVVMSGTIASGGPPDLYLTCARWAQAAGILTIVDASGEALRQALAARPGLVKPNRAELEATFGRELREERALLEAMLELHKLGAQRVVVTAGADPTLATRRAAEVAHHGAENSSRQPDWLRRLLHGGSDLATASVSQLGRSMPVGCGRRSGQRLNFDGR